MIYGCAMDLYWDTVGLIEIREGRGGSDAG